MKGILSHLFLSCIIILTPPSISEGVSQQLPKQIAFDQIGIPGTIRSSQVADVIQDDAGLIWLAGHGLFRYDGHDFKHYRELANNGGVFNPYDINQLLYDASANRILVATHHFGVVIYDYETDELHKMPTIGDPPIINCLVQTSDKKVWAGSINGGLYVVENDTLKKYKNQEEEIINPASLLAVGSTLYIGESGKILVLNDSGIEEIALTYQGTAIDKIMPVTALYLDRNNLLWVGTDKQGVFVYDVDEKEFVKYFAPSVAPFFSRISQIKEDRDGLIWILTKANGLVVYSPSEEKMVHVLRDPFSSKSLASDNCFSILEDRDGILWVGTTGDLNKYDKRQIKFEHIYHNPLNPISLTDNMVRGVYEDIDGKIWVGTDAGFINVIDFKTKSIEYRKVDINGDRGTFAPVCFLPLTNQIVLVGTSRGLLQWNRKTNTFSPYPPLWELTKNRSVRQLVRNGDYLFFIHYGKIYVHNLKSEATQHFATAGDSTAQNISTIYLDESNRLWVGSNKGISLFNQQDKTFRFFPFPELPRLTEGSLLLILSFNQVGEYLYIGTFNAGLWRIRLSTIDDPVFENFTREDGLINNTVYATLPDESGNVWMSTNNGIVKFEPEKEKFISFSIHEGLQEEEFNRLAYAKTRSGEMIFGGINGINKFHPRDVVVDDEIPHPEILCLTVRNSITDESVSRIAHPEEEVRLKYNENFLSINFFIPHYATPRRYSLFYKLDAFEKQWKEVTNTNFVSYANLPHGAYQFQLKTVGMAGEENIVKLPIVIALPYWKTWWFITLCFFVVAFLVMTIIRSYIRKAQHDRNRLQELLRIRTYEIEKSREELQVLNQKKDLIFSILSHDLRSPLTTLKGFLGYIIDHAEQLSIEDLKKHAVNIKNSVSNSLDLIDNTLFWSLSQMGNIQYTPTNFSLHHLLEKLRGLYQLTADKKRIPLTISCSKEIILHGDENMIYVTLRNIVSNALKFTQEGYPVTIEGVQRDGFAEIIVRDQGIGMSEEYLNKILSMDQPMLKKGTSNEKGTGLGLLLCFKFMEMNKGSLDIKSVEHEGTTFIVRLPMATKAAHQTMTGTYEEK